MKKFVILALCTFYASTHGHGFVAGTLVKTTSDYTPIEQIKVGDEVVCFDFDTRCVSRKVLGVHKFKARVLSHLVIHGEHIFCDAEHLFCVINPRAAWEKAQFLMKDDRILSHCTDYCLVQEVTSQNQEIEVYDLTVAEFHNYCVGHNEIHVHNVAPVIVASLSWIFGEGLTYSIGAGLAALGTRVLGSIVYNPDRKRTTFHFTHGQQSQEETAYTFPDSSSKEKTTAHSKQEEAKPKDERETGAQAPGIPTEEDGFIPPKKWDGKKVKNPNGPGYGWPDKRGDVWIPTGPNGHGCPHWDVQQPGGGYRNVVPGGRIRGQK